MTTESAGGHAGNIITLHPLKNKKNLSYEVLKKRILSNEYPPGMPINENGMSQELGVSKTPIREALQQLERDGFIETVSGRGSFVTHITIDDIREVFESREMLECGAASRVALVGDKELIRIKKQEFERSIALDGERPADAPERDDVHIFIFQMLGNRKLSFIYLQFMDQIIRLRNYFNVRFDAERTDRYDQEHLRILDAMLEGNPQQAEEATRTHLRNATEYLTGLMSP